MNKFTSFILALVSSFFFLASPACSFAAEPPPLRAVSPSGMPSTLTSLGALRGEFPISLRFRSERYDGGRGRHSPQLTETRAAFATETDGALEKMLHDIGRYGSEGQQAIAEALPEKILLEHMLFGSVSLDFAKDFGGHWPFSPCHFAYYVGCRAMETPLPAATEIKVEDATKFRQGDTVILLPMSGEKKVWEASEWAAVTAIANSTLHLQRAVYGSKSLHTQGVACDAVWVAPMPHPYSEDRKTKTELTWNWSTLCPRDEKGRQASDAFAEGVRTLFAKDGALSRMHGLAWDVPRVSFKTKGAQGERLIDADLDGVGDNGFKDGVNTYALGVVELDRKVRAALGEERIFMSDGFYGDEEDARLQLPSVFNGIEHDINTDHRLFEISSLLNVFSFYQRHVQRPQLSLLVRKDGNVERKNGGPDAAMLRQNQCMKNALATIMGIAYSDLSFARVEQGKAFSAADETQCGKEDHLHWLGKPVGPILRPALDQPDALGGAGVAMSEEFLGRWSSTNAELRRDDQCLVISARQPDAATPPDRDSLQLTLHDLPLKQDQGLLIQFEVQSEKLRDFAADVPRIMTVTPIGLPGWPEKKRQPRALLGWSTSQDFTPVSFYFREPAKSGPFTLQFAIQGRQNIKIRNFMIREATEVFARQFEHGIVFCNPNERTPWTFDLDKMFPGVTLHRIAGSDYDQEMKQENNGARIGATVTLKPQTGLFLVKESIAR